MDCTLAMRNMKRQSQFQQKSESERVSEWEQEAHTAKERNVKTQSMRAYVFVRYVNKVQYREVIFGLKVVHKPQWTQNTLEFAMEMWRNKTFTDFGWSWFERNSSFQSVILEKLRQSCFFYAKTKWSVAFFLDGKIELCDRDIERENADRVNYEIESESRATERVRDYVVSCQLCVCIFIPRYGTELFLCDTNGYIKPCYCRYCGVSDWDAYLIKIKWPYRMRIVYATTTTLDTCNK